MQSGIKNKPNIPLIACVLAVGTLAVYWRVLNCDFVNFDDNLYVTSNPHVQAGLTWSGIKWAFTSTEAANWHPLTWLSHMLDCQLYGLKPLGPHYTNLLLHIANTILLFTWLRRLTGAVWRSALVAALFAWHPMHVESVAWISERKDVLSTFFGLLTLLAYESFVQQSKIKNQKSKIFYLFSLLCFALSLLSKPMLVTLPFALLLVDWWSAEVQDHRRFFSLPWKKWLPEKIPFFALAAGCSAATFFAQHHGNAVESLAQMPPLDRLGNAAVAYVGYLGKLFWPAKLAVFYPHPGFWSVQKIIISALLLLTITVMVCIYARSKPWVAFGWFWFLGTLVPVIGLVQVGRQFIADRYSYFPSIGLFIIVAWALGEWARRARQERVTTGIATGALAACMALTFVQTGYWQNSGTLFKHDIDVAGYNFIACRDLGNYFIVDRPEEAVFYFDHAPIENPFDVPALIPAKAVAHFSLGVNSMANGELEKALTNLSLTVELEPTNAEYHLAFGIALAKKGMTNDALAQLSVAAQTAPANPKAHVQLAALLEREGKFADALAHYREGARLYRAALQHEPDSPLLINKLAWLLATNPHDEIRNGAEAVSLARHGCELTQWQSATLMTTLGAACAETGKFDEAAAMIRKAREGAIAADQKEAAARDEELLKLFLSGKVYRDNGD